MTKKNLMKGLSVAVMLFLIVGCAGLAGNSNAPKNFREGSEGITLSFLPTLPKEIVVTPTTNERISFFIQLKNKGAFPQDGQSIDGSLWLSGFDPALIEITEPETSAPFTSSINGNLQGKTATNIVGGTTTHEFVATIRTSDQILSYGKYAPTILANVCYRYETVANPSVCIEKDAFSVTNGKKACKMGDITLTSQGAPIGVTKVETISTSERMQFKISIKNLGKGSVIDTSVGCAPFAVKGVLRHQLDLIDITSVKISDLDLSCSAPDGKVRLIDGTGQFTCSIEKSKLSTLQEAFTTPLIITLSYLYKESAEKPIVINKITG